MKQTLKKGDKVKTDFYSGEEETIRTITHIEKDDYFGSGYGATADGGEPCKFCGVTKYKVTPVIDSAWFKKITKKEASKVSADKIFSLADVRNKLSPFKNLIAMLKGCEIKHSDDRINRMVKSEIEQCKKSIEYLSGNVI